MNSARIMPRDEAAAPLDVVIAVMAFLAALALGAALIAERAAESWQAGLAGRITVQIVPENGDTAALDANVARALDVLRATPGILIAEPLSGEEILKLVEPWLGADTLVAELPLPRLIDATVAPGAEIDTAALSSRLAAAVPGAVVDDHKHWIARLGELAGTIVLSAYGVLALIALATASTVAFATRAGLAANHEIVELLHLMGARAGFIAGAVERHYLYSALVASACGTLFGVAAFLLAGGLESAGIEAVPFLPPLSLSWGELAWLAAIPAGAGLIAWATARLSVLAALRATY